jgi:hypothetical protein
VDSYNNILWNNRTSVSLLNGATVVADHSNLGSTNWPGAGNISVDPRFLDLTAHDHRLAIDSPCSGAGRKGESMGPRFPVGAPMALSHPRIESISYQNIHAVISFWVDSEKTYSLLRNDGISGETWVKVMDVYPQPRPYQVSITDDLSGVPRRFYRLVTPRQR